MSLMDDYRRWRNYRRTINELEKLSTRELSDLGIGRGDIRRIARNGGAR